MHMHSAAHPLGWAARPARRTGRNTSTAPLPWPRIVGIGGGTGLPVVLRGLSEALREASQQAAVAATPDHLVAIVTVTDDGGSSGVLRRQLGVLPPGDVRNCLAALADGPSPFVEMLQHRFNGATPFVGHTVGNLMLAALTQMSGNFAVAIEQLSEVLAMRGRVYPSTLENVSLTAESCDGHIARGETAIVRRHAPIKHLWLERQVQPLPDALRALVNAEVIVVGPGSLYTSVLPNLLVGGIASTISGVNAVRIYVANLMTEPGETDGFSIDDHLRVIREHVGYDLFDYVLVNDRAMDDQLVAHYAERGSVPVPDGGRYQAAGPAQIVRRPLAAELWGDKIRHAPAALARTILELAEAGRTGDTPSAGAGSAARPSPGTPSPPVIP